MNWSERYYKRCVRGVFAAVSLCRGAHHLIHQHGDTGPWLQALHIYENGLQCHAAFLLSISVVYLPKRALLLHEAR